MPNFSTMSTAFRSDPRYLATVAILAAEPDSELCVQAISHAPRCRISTGNFLELSIVIEGQFGTDVLRQCDALFRRIGIVIEPFTVEQAHVAKPSMTSAGAATQRG
jgi:ribonuclease VapC